MGFRKPHCRGISLIEVLIAFVVFTVGVLSLLTVYPYVFQFIGERDDELQAVAFGQQYMEQVRQQYFKGTATLNATPAPTSAPVDTGYPIAFGATGYSPLVTPTPTPLASSANFTASVLSVSAVGSSPPAYDVTIQVTWPTATKPVVLESVLTGEFP